MWREFALWTRFPILETTEVDYIRSLDLRQEIEALAEKTDNLEKYGATGGGKKAAQKAARRGKWSYARTSPSMS